MAPETYRPLERRPLASRDWKASALLSGWLARRGVSPNAISLWGMACGVAAGGAFWATALLPSPGRRAAWLAAAALVQLRLLANLLDGMVAIEGGRASPVGELYNEVPDRISDACTLIGAGLAAGGNLVLGFLAACAALLTAYIRAMGKAAGAPQDYCGPMAKPHRMFVLTVVAVYSALTPEAWQPGWGPSPAPGLVSAALLLIFLGSLWTAARRLRRIARRLRGSSP